MYFRTIIQQQFDLFQFTCKILETMVISSTSIYFVLWILNIYQTSYSSTGQIQSPTSSLRSYPSLWQSLIVIITFLTCYTPPCCVQAAMEFQGYRLIQYEYKGKLFGSWKSTFHAIVDVLSIRRLLCPYLTQNGNINNTIILNFRNLMHRSSRTVYIVRLLDINFPLLLLIRRVIEKSSGIIFLMPRNLNDAIKYYFSKPCNICHFQLLINLFQNDTSTSSNECLSSIKSITTPSNFEKIREIWAALAKIDVERNSINVKMLNNLTSFTSMSDIGLHNNQALLRLLYKTKIKDLKAMEEYLITNKFNLPIYFAYDENELTELYETLSNLSCQCAEMNFCSYIVNCCNIVKHGLNDGLYVKSSTKMGNSTRFLIPNINIGKYLTSTYFTVNSPAAIKVHKIKAENIIGSLFGHDSSFSGTNPSLLIVTHYDSFAAAPTLAIGANSNGSGVIITLELLRLLSNLYASLEVLPKYNLIFLFTSASINFKGIEAYLSNVYPRLSSSIEFALCLDSLFDINEDEEDNKVLFLHLIREPIHEAARKLISSLEVAASRHNHTLSIKIKKIDENNLFTWEHEKFSIYNIEGGTISRQATRLSILQRFSLFDYNFPSYENIIAIVKIIVEGITFHIFNLTEINFSKDIQFFEGSLAPSHLFIKSWQRVISNSPRFYPFIIDEDKFLLELKKSVLMYSHKVDFMNFNIDDKDFVFYTDIPVAMKASIIRNSLFDFLHLILNLVYMIILYALIK